MKLIPIVALALLLAPQLASAQTIVISPTTDALLRQQLQVQQRTLQELDVIRQILATIASEPATPGRSTTAAPN